MSARLIDGKAISAAVREEIRKEVQALNAAGKRVPGLGVILVGLDPASSIYVRHKREACLAADMHSVVREMPESSSQADVLAAVEAMNRDEAIDGILVQQPVPKQVSGKAVIIRPRAQFSRSGLFTAFGRFVNDPWPRRDGR